MDVLLDLPTLGPHRGPSLIDAFLAQQQSLTAVERFARLHEAGQFEQPAQARRYRDLIPLTVPQPGEQYAFTVDLDACSGCKACVTACHSLNGLDDCETFRDVGALTGRDSRGLHVLQHVTTACHHCLEPACLTGCPTLAYEKDPATGIVRHLDDQCIGCQYCTLMCPYDVPKYNAAKGIVRKCDMCRQRLVDGEAPACVQACPSQAIRIELVHSDAVRQRSRSGDFLPHAPEPGLTQPTTRFITRRQPLYDIEPVDDHDRPADAHLPLVFMLVLTQMSIGMFFVAEGMLLAGTRSLAVVISAAAVGLIGLATAVLHLGRPQIAYRAWLGWRTSWMSREIIAFSVFAAFAVAGASGSWWVEYGIVPATYSVPGAGGQMHFPRTQSVLLLATCLSGIAALFCSAMIYAATGREFWSAGRTISRFVFTAALLGPAGALAIVVATGGGVSPVLTGVVIAAALARLLADATQFQHVNARIASQLARSSELLTGPLNPWNSLQAGAAFFGGLILPLIMLEAPQFAAALVLPAAVLLIAAELVQRGLFFAAVVAPRMPGVQHA